MVSRLSEINRLDAVGTRLRQHFLAKNGGSRQAHTPASLGSWPKSTSILECIPTVLENLHRHLEEPADLNLNGTAGRSLSQAASGTAPTMPTQAAGAVRFSQVGWGQETEWAGSFLEYHAGIYTNLP